MPATPHKPDSGDPAPSALDRASARMHALLAQGQLGAGQPLIEIDLAERLGVARSTVREVLRRLESEGLVVARRRGMQVRRLTRADVVDLYDARELLEGLAARRAAERMGHDRPIEPGRLAAERKLWTGIRSEFAVAAFSSQNRRFHQLLIAASGNRHLGRMLDQTLLELFAAQFRPWLGEASIGLAAVEHLRILDSVARAAPGDAERAMRAHIRSSAKMILGLSAAAFD